MYANDKDRICKTLVYRISTLTGSAQWHLRGQNRKQPMAFKN